MTVKLISVNTNKQRWRTLATTLEVSLVFIKVFPGVTQRLCVNERAMSKTGCATLAKSAANDAGEGVPLDRNVLNTLLYRHLPDLLSLHRECRWIITKMKQRPQAYGTNGNEPESRLVSFVRVVEKLIKKLQSLHNIAWEPTMEQPLRALEKNIVDVIFPVRDKLHRKWKRQSPNQSLASSSASSVSSCSISSSTKTSREESASDTPRSSAAGGTSVTSDTGSRGVGENTGFCLPVVMHSANKVGRIKANLAQAVSTPPTKPALRAGAGPGPAIFLATSASSSAISRGLLRAGVPQSDTVGNNCNNFPSFSIVKGVVVDTPWYELIKKDSKTNLQSKSSSSGRNADDCEQLDDMSVHSDCTGENNWGLQFNLGESNSNDIDIDTDNLLESWGIYDTSILQSIDQSTNVATSTVVDEPSLGPNTVGSITNNETANKSRKVSSTTMSTSAEIIDTLSVTQQQLLRTIVPVPRGARIAEYTCSLCNTSYIQAVNSNPWWSLYTHTCSHCKKVQIPRIDIGTYINSVELDPYNAALYGEGVAEDTTD